MLNFTIHLILTLFATIKGVVLSVTYKIEKYITKKAFGLLDAI